MMTEEEIKQHQKAGRPIYFQANRKELEIKEVSKHSDQTYVLVDEGGTFRALPLRSMKKREDDIFVNDHGYHSPAFSYKEWKNDRPAILTKLKAYYQETSPRVNEDLTNVKEDTHQGYEGSSQISQREKKGPEPAEGMDYDKAKGLKD